jgi:hypothetical protein
MKVVEGAGMRGGRRQRTLSSSSHSYLSRAAA